MKFFKNISLWIKSKFGVNEMDNQEYKNIPGTYEIPDGHRQMAIGDLAFVAYVKKLVPYHPSEITRPRLMTCVLCNSEMPTSTHCGACDCCLRDIEEELKTNQGE